MIEKIQIKLTYLIRKWFWNVSKTQMIIYNLDSNKKNIRISSSTIIENKKSLKIASDVFIGHFNFIEASHGIQIGEGVQITNYCSLLTHSSHDSIRLYGKSYFKQKDLKGYLTGNIEIGPYTFIGPHAVVMPKSKIGKGCIVTAFSYCQGNYPDYSVISGNPAVIVGDTRVRDDKWLKMYPELKGQRPF